MRSEIGSLITTMNGIRAYLVRVEFSLHWNRLTPEEKKPIRTRYGRDAKQKYHQYTRVFLKRLVWTQSMFPSIDWYEES